MLFIYLLLGVLLNFIYVTITSVFLQQQSFIKKLLQLMFVYCNKMKIAY